MIINYQSVIRMSCGSVLLLHGLNFSRAWWTMQLVSGEKGQKHVSVQKVVTLNICCNAACLTFHLPHSTNSSFQNHQCQPTNSFFSEPPTFGGTQFMQHPFSQMKKLCTLQGISQNRCKTEIYLQWKTNWKSNMAYQMAGMAVQGHSQVAALFKCNLSHICAAFYTITTDSVLAVPLR